MITRSVHALKLATLCFGMAVALTLSANAQVFPPPAGVEVDASGILKTRVYADPGGELTKMRIRAAKEQIDADLQKPADLRMVSLQRLEASIKDRLNQGLPLTDDQKNLAGLTAVSHVFFYPTTQDIVIAGPAEGYFTDLAGRVVGINSGKPILQLEDLVVALRAFPPTGESVKVIGVSIDPTQEGSRRLQETVNAFRGRFPGNAELLTQTLREALGNQVVTIKGVSPKTRFAQVLVEADYRMKLIGIGLESSPVNFKTYIDSARPNSSNSNQLQRWYFVPDYHTIQVSEDELSMALVGQGAKLVSADEIVNSDGSRASTASVSGASKAFTGNFTKNFPKIAEKSPVFADLKNMIDLAIVAAYIQDMNYYEKSGWEMALFGDENKIQTERFHEPREVAAAINAVWKGNYLMTPIGGGVNIQPRQALATSNMQYDESGKVEQARNHVNIDGVEAKRWWWN
ncbi:MAG TPA: DUF1598 domain-containing protein [Pirellulaceae bacterium]|nr:DUF1598 domain-containing protein [Pirellulaceae bacterium]HMO91400.1 DUF1598 domain-containing protein [Pirellulaceae bacterium]HMP69625.1 DUF1598 domain-containing protein [Pirellulaceae bacterium]